MITCCVGALLMTTDAGTDKDMCSLLAVSGDAVLQSVEAAQVEGDAVLTQLKAMFPAIAKQKVQQGWRGSSAVTSRGAGHVLCELAETGRTCRDAVHDKTAPAVSLQDLLSALIQDRAHAKCYRPPSAQFSTATRMWARLKAALLLVAVLWSLPLSLLAVAGSILSEWASLAARGGSAETRGRAQKGLQGRAATTPLRGTAIVSGGR